MNAVCARGIFHFFLTVFLPVEVYEELGADPADAIAHAPKDGHVFKDGSVTHLFAWEMMLHIPRAFPSFMPLISLDDRSF